jgi:hypothetical protein
VAFIIRALRLREVEYKSVYRDVYATDWYASNIVNAYDKNIIEKDETYFSPENPITREKAVSYIMAAYRGMTGKYNLEIEGNTAKFSDISMLSEKLVSDINSAAKLNIINGIDNFTFAPNNTLTREQAAKIIIKLCELVNR